MKGTFTFLSDCFDCVHMVQVYCTRVLHGNALTIPSRSRVFFPVPTSVVSVPASTTPNSVPFPASYCTFLHHTKSTVVILVTLDFTATVCSLQ